jgi:hypothetical protein
VASSFRRIVVGEINDTARRLLREMGNQASGWSRGDSPPEVVPREAAQNLDLDPEAPEYTAALNHLLALGDIERVSGSVETEPEGLYRLTIQGIRRAHELRWWR